ncbi:MAG: replication initiation protein [Pseudomonadota bacterium]
MDYEISEDTGPRTQTVRTIDLTPEHGEMLKPVETVDIVGTEPLTLHDKRVWNSLLANAHGPTMGVENTDFRIALSELRDTHHGNDRVNDSIERLMKTVVRYRAGDVVKRFQLLGGNDMGNSDREHGYLVYRFDKNLIELLGNSTMFAKLRLEVVAAFSSKYALALYEHIARRVRMKHRFMQDYTVQEMREILGVPDNRLKSFGSLKQKAIDPALNEINALAEFNAYMASKRTGKKITHVTMSWHWKNPEDRDAAFAELKRPKAGRKERIRGTTEGVVEPEPLELPLIEPELRKRVRA